MLINDKQFQCHFEALNESGLNMRIGPLIKICPICMNPFSDNEEMKMATKEDAPPESLGGRKVVFTCKKCNSRCGELADIHVMNFIKRLDQQNFLEGSNRNIRIYNSETVINGELIVGKNKNLLMNISKKNNDSRILSSILSTWMENTTLDIQNKKVKLERNNLNSGILKTAYILLYSHIGYNLLNWLEYDKIRSQIQNPEKSIIPPLWTAQNLNINNGIYITNEVWLRGFIIVFSLINPDTKVSHKILILIPAPQTDIQIANYFLNKIGQGDRLSLMNISEIDFLNNPMNIVQLNKWAYGKSLCPFKE